MESLDVIHVSDLIYRYEGRKTHFHSEQVSREGQVREVILRIDSLTVRRGERVLICGANGAGKSTFLSILGGRKLVQSKAALILNRECFSDCSLGEQVCYLGDWWRTDFFLDTTVRAFLGSKISENARCQDLCKILQVNLEWRISQLSDGQRRRCQIVAALTASESFEVYILDEVTADLDIVSREHLLRWLMCEAEERNATVLLATHIMDGMTEWATRIVFMENGSITKDRSVSTLSNLYATVRDWVFEAYNASDSGP